jgi:hypothetical protein
MGGNKCCMVAAKLLVMPWMRICNDDDGCHGNGRVMSYYVIPQHVLQVIIDRIFSGS